MSIKRLIETLKFDTIPIIKAIEQYGYEKVKKNLCQLYFLDCFRNFCIWFFGIKENDGTCMNVYGLEGICSEIGNDFLCKNHKRDD